MSGSYRIEVSTTNRAGCKNTECKKEDIKIQKGRLRFGVFITGPEWQSWAWKHWGCVTPKQILNVKKDIEGEPSQLDGYDELPEDLQEKVANALQQGHVDDEDWGWDVELNREGKNGYRTLETKRRLKAEAQIVVRSNYPKALKEEAAGEGSASPSKADTKKRGLVKDDPDAKGVAESEPPAKKTKVKTKKEPKIKNEVASGESENEGLTTKKAKSRAKKEPKIKNEDAEVRSENDGPAKKKTKAATKKGKKANDDDTDGDFEQDAQPVKKGRRQTKKPTAGEEPVLQIKDESSDHDAIPPPAAKKTRAPRKATTTKKLKDEGKETDDPDPVSRLQIPVDNVKLEHASEPEAEASEGAPKLPKAARKKSRRRSTERQKRIQKKSSPRQSWLPHGPTEE